jgi:hypothetical protein
VAPLGNVSGVTRVALASAVVALAAACGAADPCDEAPPEDPDCPDLTFSGDLYDEWRPVEPPAVTEELGDARYPACNDEEPCNGPDLGGFAATDVWLLEGVDPEDALIGLRQGTKTHVVFLRRGLDPSTVEGLPSRPTAEPSADG